MAKIGLVAGSGRQRSMPALAELLYVSPLFQKLRRYVTVSCDQWYILSARYGLVQPDEVIAPYPEVFDELSRQDRFRWGRVVQDGLLRLRVKSYDSFVVFAGVTWREFLVPVLEGRNYRYEVPLDGLNVVRQYRWLDSI